MRTRRYSLTLALATTVMALALAACSADADPETVDEAAAPGQASAAESASGLATEPDAASRPTDDSMEIHPCLLTGADLASVLGGAYDDGILAAEFSEFPNYLCEYTNTETGVGALVITVVMPRGFSAQDQRPGYESQFDDVVDVTLPGADYAFAASGGSIVAAQVGEYTVYLANNQDKGADPDGNTLRLAQIAVDNV